MLGGKSTSFFSAKNDASYALRPAAKDCDGVVEVCWVFACTEAKNVLARALARA